MTAAHSEFEDQVNRRIVAVVDDMFFVSKIRAASESLGVDVKFVRTLEQFATAATESKPDLIVVDLHTHTIDVVALAKMVRTNEELRSVRLIGFFSHVEAEVQRAAIEAGYDRVIPRSVFSRDLATLLKG
jgi:PleD family two-component response regulator